MAFTAATLALASVGKHGSPNIWTYVHATDTVANAVAANYWAPGSGYSQRLTAKDVIVAQMANGTAIISVTAAAATTSTVAQIVGTVSGAVTAPIYVGPIVCTGYGTAGRVGSFIAPVAGTMLSWRHITDTVVTADNVLNLDLAGTNATGSVTVALSDTAVDIIDSATITAGGVVTAGQLVTVESDGAGDTGAGRIWVLIQPS
jgi:hypothetical protein